MATIFCVKYLALIQTYERFGAKKPQKHIFTARSPEAALDHVIEILDQKEDFKKYEATWVDNQGDTIRMSREHIQRTYLQCLSEDFCELLIDDEFTIIHEQK